MKKKSSIFFALLFVATMAFSFGMATTTQAENSLCCDFGCAGGKGHLIPNPIDPDLPQICVRDYIHWCDIVGNCQ